MEQFSDQEATRSAAHQPSTASGPSLLDGVAIAVYSVDEDGLCKHINAAAALLLGYSEQECLGRNMHELIHYKHPDGSPFPIQDCPLVQARAHGAAAYDLHETVWRKDGTPVRASCSAIPLATQSGLGVTIVTLNDITTQYEAEIRAQHAEQQQAEAMRQRDATARVEQDLAQENTARQRDASLAIERAAADQLRLQQRQAEERLAQSERLAAVGLLAASISHEINNPLEAVTNLLYLVRTDTSLSEESMEYLRMAEQELGRVTTIVARTLTFQRGSGAASNCVPEALIDSVITLHQGSLRNSGIRIDRQHRRSSRFRCPEGEVRQVLNNLISNAIDAMRSTGGTITVRTQPAHCVHTGRPGLRFTVADTGAGMSKATTARIFEALYTTKAGSGSGLGLSISHDIAHRYGGHLRVRSCSEGERRGTTFSLFLPEIEAESKAAATIQ